MDIAIEHISHENYRMSSEVATEAIRGFVVASLGRLAEIAAVRAISLHYVEYMVDEAQYEILGRDWAKMVTAVNTDKLHVGLHSGVITRATMDILIKEFLIFKVEN